MRLREIFFFHCLCVPTYNVNCKRVVNSVNRASSFAKIEHLKGEIQNRFNLKVHRNPSNFAFICTQVGLILDIFLLFVCKKHYFEKYTTFPASLCALLNFLSPAAPPPQIVFLLQLVSRDRIRHIKKEKKKRVREVYCYCTLILRQALFCHQKCVISSLFPLIN